ncbi:MAG: hypothetical protein ACK56I_26325, partial [bacterium]
MGRPLEVLVCVAKPVTEAATVSSGPAKAVEASPMVRAGKTKCRCIFPSPCYGLTSARASVGRCS